MKKILIIEDDKSIKESIIDLLKSEGFDVYFADNGIEGIKFAKEVIPDLIICDIIMPGKTGYDVIEELSKEPETAVIPFIFLTAKVDKQDVRHGMELGADDYLTKPFRITELLKAIEVRLKKKQMMQAESSREEISVEAKNNKLSKDDHVFVSVNGKPKFLKIDEIKCIVSEAEYTRVFTIDNEKLLIRKLLKDWEEILPESSFLRIHRSTIVNLNFVSKIEKWFNNSYLVRIQNLEKDFVISRRYASSIKTRLNYS